MNKWAGIIAAVILATPAAAAAQGSEGIRLFNDICLATKGREADVEAKARAMGFVKPPAAVAKGFASPQLPNAVGFWRVVDGGLYMVLTGNGPVPFDDEISGEVCAVMAYPNVVDVETQLGTLLGLTGNEKISGLSAFIYEVQDGKRRSLSSKSALSINRAIEASRLQLVMSGNLDFMDKEQATIVMLMVPKPKT